MFFSPSGFTTSRQSHEHDHLAIFSFTDPATTKTETSINQSKNNGGLNKKKKKKKKKTNIVSATTGCPNKFWMDIFLTENLKNAKLEFSKKFVKKNCQIEVRFALLS